jgi:hypothetical protein
MLAKLYDMHEIIKPKIQKITCKINEKLVPKLLKFYSVVYSSSSSLQQFLKHSSCYSILWVDFVCSCIFLYV